MILAKIFFVSLLYIKMLNADLPEPWEKIVNVRVESADVYSVDKKLRPLEKNLTGSLFELIVFAANSFTSRDFSKQTFASNKEAMQSRYIHTPILYKLGMAAEAAQLAQNTFEYLFPELHEAVEKKLIVLFGDDYQEKCHAVVRDFLTASDRVARASYRIKSTHSIWKKVPSLEALETMTREEFLDCVNDFIGVRWEMRVAKGSNRYDALIEGVWLSPMSGLISFRNQQLKQSSGFENEPVIKLCYIVEGIPIELQLLGGRLNAYMCAKGYSNYKIKLALPPRKEDLSEEQWNRRLGMAIQLEESGELSLFREFMRTELTGVAIDYSEFDPFILDSLPILEKNRWVRFSGSSVPICELDQMIFHDEPSLD
jgi:hypothetical protein